MSATLEAPPAKPTAAPAEATPPPPAAPSDAPAASAYRGEAGFVSSEPVLMTGVSWPFYLIAREQLAEAFHITYDCGRMEIMPPPSMGHDRPKIIVSSLLELYLLARDIRFDGIGSTTLQREDLLKGCEPDEAFYVAETPVPPGLQDLDLTVHRPPNLVIEVDRTSRSIAKEPIYAAMGVTEFWRWRGKSLTVRRLREDHSGYDDSPASGLLPDLPVDQLAAHVRLGQELAQSDVLKRWRDAIK